MFYYKMHKNIGGVQVQKLQCEICGSNDLVKTGEYFVCEHCGTKYTKEDLKDMINVKVDVEVNDKHWEEAKKQANAEAEQLDYEISLLEEYKALRDEYETKLEAMKAKNKSNENTGDYICIGGAFGIAFLFEILAGGKLSVFQGLVAGALGWGVYGALKFLVFRPKFAKAREAEEEYRKEAFEKLNPKWEKIKSTVKLIPEKFWPEVNVVRDYYKNWGATNQRDLLNHLEEHFRKPDVIERTRTVHHYH